MFATTFYLEREPLSVAELPGAMQSWLQNGGAIAALIFGAAWLYGRSHQDLRQLQRNPLITLSINLAGILYAALGVLFIASKFGGSALARWLPGNSGNATLGDYMLTIAGGLALLAVTIPIITAFFTRIRWQRIWALATVSIKEAVRKRVLWVFAAMALIFLFAGWFVSSKAEDQLRNYVAIVYWSILILFVLIASLLGAFSIPNDVKNQSIHIIVTKPVEKFEIVLGRFLGYSLLLTVGLVVIACLSLIYVLRGINPDAAEESLKARLPIYGNLGFYRTKGDSVGREWAYRKYIGGPQPAQLNAPHQYASWAFNDLPANLADQSDPVAFEFTFDIFRLNKGQEGKGIFCTFTFADGRLGLLEIEQNVKTIQTERNQQQAELLKKPMTPAERDKAYARINDALIEKYGIVEVAGKDVTKGHTQALQVPAALFKRLNELEKSKPRSAEPGDSVPTPMMNVLVNVDSTSPQQMLGVARRDFYLLAGQHSFAVNFLKGIVGMWCTFMLVLGVAVACSTYLSGVISWLCTMFLFGAGLFTDYIQRLAEGKEAGGGPLESAYRLMNHSPLAVPIDPGATANLITGADDIYRWWLRRFLNMLPDMSRYDLHQYVANGFDISWNHVLLVDNILPLIGYLLPWAILAFYLMKFREIANPT